MTAAYADTTRTAYAFAWGRWESWCAGRGVVPLPAEPSAVCAYLTQCAEQGLSLATIDSACSVIGHQYRSRGVWDAIDHQAVRQVRRGLCRLLVRAARRPARPLSVEDLRRIVTAIDRSTVRGVRDTAILLLGFAGALRRSELAALTLADLEAKPGGCCCTCAAPRPTPRRGHVVGIPTATMP
jgi:site-specific recombinase XerD